MPRPKGSSNKKPSKDEIVRQLEEKTKEIERIIPQAADEDEKTNEKKQRKSRRRSPSRSASSSSGETSPVVTKRKHKTARPKTAAQNQPATPAP
jgi:hypothetical protein